MVDIVEERKHCGIYLEDQRRNYPVSLKPWDSEAVSGKYQEYVGTDPNYLLEIARAEFDKVAKAQDLGDLVKIFIICNLNDFKPYQDWKNPNNPSEKEFRDLLADHTKWNRRTHRFVLTRKNEVIRSQLDLLDAAKNRYRELSKTQAK